MFDGEWTSKNKEAEQIMIASGEVLFDPKKIKITQVFVDPRA